MQLDSIQAHMPTPQYTDMRRERTGDIGRPAAMPGLTVHMDASGHNYSSARFDDRGYWRANARWQGFCARRRMNPYVHAVLREAETSGLLPPRQGEIRLNWQWPKSEGVDQQKEAMARRQRMQNFSASPIMVAAEEGADLERVIADNARFHDMLLSTGLDQQWVNAVMYTVFTGQTINPMANPGDSNADDDEPNQP
jgi:hypothetical protein